MLVSSEVEKAFKAAKLARLRAHVPYSHFQVGAALQIKESSEAIVGCNVENASFGATICAERSALLSAISRHGPIHPEFLVVVTDDSSPTVPCALCLQVLAEFCANEMPVHLANLQGVQITRPFKEFLPYPFRAFTGAARP